MSRKYVNSIIQGKNQLAMAFSFITLNPVLKLINSWTAKGIWELTVTLEFKTWTQFRIFSVYRHELRKNRRYKCSCLHEIEQIAMRSVCLEMSSNMFMILFRVEIDYSRPKTSLSEKFALNGGLCLVELTRRQLGARGCLQKQKKSCLF